MWLQFFFYSLFNVDIHYKSLQWIIIPSSLSGWFCLLVRPSSLCGCFLLFAWFVNCTSTSLSEEDWCGTDFVDTCLFVELVETAEFLKMRFLILLTTFPKTISACGFFSLDTRPPEVQWSTCEDSEQNNASYALLTRLNTWLLMFPKSVARLTIANKIAKW